MELVNCNLCGQNTAQPFKSLPDRYSGETFQLVQCNKCDLIYLSPRPTAAEIAHYYPAQYEPHTTTETAVDQWRMQQVRQKQLAFVHQYHPQPGYLMDIGCATGEFLRTARENNWRVSGIEMVAEAAQVARDEHGLDVSVGAAEDLLTEAAGFDVITLWDVLEHLANPRAVLEKCQTALRPGGFLILAIPNLDSYERYLFGSAWLGWEVPRHLYFFTPQTLERLLDDTGFALRDASTLTGGRGVFSISLETAVAGKAWAPLVKKLMPLLLAGLWPYRQFSYWRQKSSIITYVAQKL